VRAHGFPQLRELITSIEQILIGRTAALMDPNGFEGAVSIVRLPVWAELKPQIDVGQKAKKNVDLVLPARIEWTVPPLVVLAHGESVQAEWSITNMGHHLSGAVTISSAGLSDDVPGQLECRVIDAFSSRDLERKLARLIKEGVDAKWLILQSFENYTRAKLDEANRILAQELSEYHGKPIHGVVDEIAIDSLLTHMLFGEGETSIVSRMVDKALHPDAFKTYDPARYFSLNLKSRALGEVRRIIGDPHIGTKVRRLHKLTGAATLEDLVSAYNEQYPKEHLGAKRASSALTAGPEVQVTAVALVSDEELRAYSGRRGSSGAA
jgi:hypothetical protein